MYEKLLAVLLIFVTFTGCISNQAETIKGGDNPQEFEIRPTTWDNCVMSEDGNFTILILTNDTELINWSDTYITFDIWALTQTGATVNDYNTLYFSVKDYDTQLFKYKDEYQIRWELDDEQWLVQGSKTMPYTKKYNMSLVFDFNIYEIARTTQSHLTIRFANKEDSWSQEYEVNFVAVDISG